MEDLTRAGVFVLDAAVGLANGDDLLSEVIDGVGGAGTEVEDAAVALGREAGFDDELREVFDVDEVPGLVAIAEDGEGLVLGRALQEDGDDAGVGACGVLAWAIDVEEAQAGGGYAVDLVIIAQL